VAEQSRGTPSAGEVEHRHIHQLAVFWPVVIFAATLLTHGFYIFEMAGHPFFNFPLVDSRTYHLQAMNILRHGWIGDKVFWQAPLYPYFLALCYHFITVKFFDIRLIQAVLAAFNNVLLYLLGRRVLGRTWAAVAAVAAAFYGPLIYFDCEMLAPVLVVFFYLAMALALEKAIRDGSLWPWAAAGLADGFAALSHGLALLIAPFVCAYALAGGRMRRSPLRKRLAAAGLSALGTGLVIFPVTLRNRIVGGEWVLISHNGPVNFYIGNHPDYDRMVGLRPGLEWSSLARDLEEHGVSSASGEARYFLSATLANVRSHPAALARVWLKKIFLFFNADEIKRNYPIYPVRRYSHLMRLLMWKWPGPRGIVGLGFPFGIVLPLALLGWWALKKGGVRFAAVEMILAGHFLANLLFFICSRYRIPVVPFLLLYAAAGVRWAAAERIWRADRLGRNAVVLLLVLMAFLASNAALKPMDRPKERAEYEFYLGFVSQKRGKVREALDHYLKALGLDPDLTEAHFFLGILYQDHLGRPADALEQFDWVLARDPGNMPVLFNKALALASLGKRAEARAIVEKLVASDPKNAKYRRFLEHLSEKETIPESGNRTKKPTGTQRPL